MPKNNTEKVFEVMSDGKEYSLSMIQSLVREKYGTQILLTAVSARVRDLRKSGFKVERRMESRGLWFYKIA